jgi:hypothetical protein
MSKLMDIARSFRFDPSKPLGSGVGGHHPYDINDKNDQRGDSPYHERAMAALAGICRADYPAGMIPWLGDNHPGLYHELTGRLPDEIHRRWIEQVPLAEFEHIFDLLLEVHRTACELYLKAQRSAAPKEPGEALLRDHAGKRED